MSLGQPVAVRVAVLLAWRESLEDLIENAPNSEPAKLEELIDLQNWLGRACEIVGVQTVCAWTDWKNAPDGPVPHMGDTPQRDLTRLVVIALPEADSIMTRIVELTGIPHFTLAITGETFDEWSQKLEELIEVNPKSLTQVIADDVRVRSPQAALTKLQMLAGDDIHKVRNANPTAIWPNYVLRASGATVILRDRRTPSSLRSQLKLEKEVRELIRNIEQLTQIMATYANQG